MKLQEVRIKDYRSIEDSGTFAVDQVSCLVGKNEAGKSAILMALASLNPHAATPIILNKERDYPRRKLTRYQQDNDKKEALVVSTTWTLDPEEVEQINKRVGDGVLKSHEVWVSRRYDQEIEIDVDLDCELAVQLLYKRFGLNKQERSLLGSPKTTSELIATLDGVDTLSDEQTRLKIHVDEVGDVSHQVKSTISEMLPKFMYFSSYDRMEGAIQLEKTQELISNGVIQEEGHQGTRLFSEFLEYAGVSINDIMAVTTYETFNAKLQAASNNITDQILDYWTQNPDIDVEVRVEKARSGDPSPFNEGTIARARIKNQLHRVDTPFSERSAGFVWFFSFLVKFAQVKETDSPVLLLLDEPGLSLHGKAQADLLRFIEEKLAPHHQILYSTHSPFMIPPNRFSSIRIVEDRVSEEGPRRISDGTKVSEDVLALHPDTLFPLQGALGYEITQSLFVGKHVLLVEGPSDILYLQALSEILTRRGKTGLDSRWTLCPSGGIDKIMPFITLFRGNELHVAVLSDRASSDKEKVRRIHKSHLLQSGHFYTIADFLEKEEADIEDVFEVTLFLMIVNRAYELEEPHVLTMESIEAAGISSNRIVKRLEAAFRLFPEEIPTYNHFTPAAWLIKNLDVLDHDSASVRATLSQAESIFDTYNQLL